MAESGFKKMFVDEGLCFVGQSLVNNQLNKVRLAVQKQKNPSNLTSGTIKFWLSNATTVGAFDKKICLSPQMEIRVGAPVNIPCKALTSILL